MKLIYACTSCFLAVAAPGLAQAGGPVSNNLDGIYAIQMSTTCQQIGSGSGTFSQTVGVIQFKPASASALSGTLTATLTQLIGGLKVGAGKSKISSLTDPSPLPGTYAVTLGSGVLSAATIVVTFNGSPALTFTGYLSQSGTAPVAGIFDSAAFVSVDDPNGQSSGCETLGNIQLTNAVAPPA